MTCEGIKKYPMSDSLNFLDSNVISWVKYQPEENSSTKGTYCQVHCAIIVHVHGAMDAATKVLQARSQLCC